MKKKILILTIIKLYISSLNACLLDELAEKYNTDKGPKWHNYTPIYDLLFSKYQDKPIVFAEIGFFKGYSARMWDEYFTQAKALYFLDIDQNCINYTQGLTERCHLKILDQGNKNALLRFARQANDKFDLIIDDGSHEKNDIISSFITLFPYIKSGGMYVIEDTHTSYWQNYGGNGTFEHPKAGKGTAIEFFKSLVDQVGHIGARTKCADSQKCPDHIKYTLNYYQKNIKSLSFFSGLCIITKH